MFDNRREIMQNVFLTYLPAQRFKTSRMTVQLIAPLQRETAAANALLPAVLRRGTVRCPDMESLSAALDTLYGANIDYTVRKKGERQCVGFAAGFIDDAFTPHGEKLLEPVSAMLGELLLDPVTHGGRFLSSYVESEKANLIDAIRGLKNDKRDWADIRLMQEMCAGEPYSVLRLGDEETAGRITNQSLYVHGQELMASSRVEVIYCGSAEAQRVEDAVLTALAALPRGAQTALPEVQRIQAPDTPRRIVETMDVTQGKLAMGYRCSSDDYPAMVLANLIFGGTSNSKLFLNVRERLSLCYYASSSYARSKNILTVSSGVETADFERAEAEIGRQLQAVQQGDWEDWEQEGALQAIRASLLSLSDSQGALENFYLGQIAAGVEETPEELAAALEEERVQLALVEETCGKGFYWTPLTDAPLVAVVPPDFPWAEDVIPLERLLQETFLSCPEQYVARLLPPEAPRLEVTASDDAAILSMVAAGLGVSVLSAFSLAGYEGQVRVLPLAEPLSRRLGAAVKTPPPANSAVRYFLSFLKRQYPAEPADNE